MATSGTIGTTLVDTAMLLEHAFRRSGVPAIKQTPELVAGAQESLYMLLLSLANEGLNLWCLDKIYYPLVTGKARYMMPTGTLDITNVVFSNPTLITTTDTVTANSVTADLGSAQSAVRIGVSLDSYDPTDTLTIKYSADNVTYTTLVTQIGNLVDVMWFDVDSQVSVQYWRASVATTATLGIAVAGSVYDLPMSSWNRDTYLAMPNKAATGRPCTNYFPERKLDTYLTVWPVPTTAWDHLTIFRHRQIQDIGSLTEQIEIPQRWLEGITWHAALRIGMEAPNADPKKLQICVDMADRYTLSASSDEEDGTPLYIQPNILGYTK